VEQRRSKHATTSQVMIKWRDIYFKFLNMFGQSRSITPGRCALSAFLHGLSLQHQRILNAIEGVHNMGYSMTNKPSGVGRATSM
jgi:hypothetical protein